MGRLSFALAIGFAMVWCHGKPLAAQTPQVEPPQEELVAVDSLVKGINQDKQVTLLQLREWLAGEQNHQPLQLVLPIGLRNGESEISGIDENPLTRAKIELGRQLYFDKRLSIDQTISCASCHAPEQGFTTDDRVAVGIQNQKGNRNSPTVINRLMSEAQFHDGRAESLEAQAVGPIENPIEMGFSHEGVVKRLASVEGYKLQFEAIFDAVVTIENVGRALASFERTLLSGASPWDYYVRQLAFEETYSDDLIDRALLKEEDPELAATYDAILLGVAQNPISTAAKRGGRLFFSQRVHCISCHAGANFTDESFHNLGVGLQVAESPDLGRFEVTQDADDRGRFKTPTLRNVALTAPYMHDGSIATLEEVVDWYTKGGHPNPQLDDEIVPFQLSAAERKDLVAFLRSLTGKLPVIEQHGLPE